MWYFTFFLLIAVIAAIPWWLESRRQKIGKAARKNAAGKFVKLRRGVTHYQWSGSVRGPVAVLIHGLNTPSAVWDEVGEGIGMLGYRVLTYDLYGCGLSDAPRGPQDAAFFVDQLSELLENQGIEEEITLVGYSMGGAIATAFAARNPHRMKQLVMLASAGVATNESSFSKFCRTNPIIGDWVHGSFGAWRMLRELKMSKSDNPTILTAQTNELQRKGFMRSVLASRRGILADMLEQEHRELSRADVPVFAIWGTNDHVIPIGSLGRLVEWNRTVRQEQIDGAGHELPYSHSAEVVSILRSLFLERHN
jgi:pimeloyl-ACP methyl ester carboxylesterase